MVASIVNDEYVDVDYKLRNTDNVKILNDNLANGSKERWLD